MLLIAIQLLELRLGGTGHREEERNAPCWIEWLSWKGWDVYGDTRYWNTTLCVDGRLEENRGLEMWVIFHDSIYVIVGLGIKLIDLETEYSTGPNLLPGRVHWRVWASNTTSERTTALKAETSEMKGSKPGEQLQRMWIRPTSGTVVGTTTGVTVPREQSRGGRIPSKPSNLAQL